MLVHQVEKRNIVLLLCLVALLCLCAACTLQDAQTDRPGDAVVSDPPPVVSIVIHTEPTDLPPAQPLPTPTETPAPSPTPGFLPAFSAADYPLNGKYIALTFDDGPHDKYTRAILEILAENNVVATFFVSGRRAEQWPEILKEMVAAGHEIGNHTYSHKGLAKISTAQAREQLERTNAIILAACGVEAKLVRPPYGQMKKSIPETFPEYTFVLWTIDPRDWETKDTKGTIHHVLKKAKDGGIILLHDIKKATVGTVDPIVKGLLAEGYTFVTVSTLLAIQELREA